MCSKFKLRVRFSATVVVMVTWSLAGIDGPAIPIQRSNQLSSVVEL
jgi:hypothetical protein